MCFCVCVCVCGCVCVCYQKGRLAKVECWSCEMQVCDGLPHAGPVLSSHIRPCQNLFSGFRRVMVVQWLLLGLDAGAAFPVYHFWQRPVEGRLGELPQRHLKLRCDIDGVATPFKVKQMNYTTDYESIAREVLTSAEKRAEQQAPPPPPPCGF